MINIITKIAFFIASFFPLWGIMIYLVISKYGYDGFYLFVYVGIIMTIGVCASHVKTDIRNTKRKAENTKEIYIYTKTETTKEYVFSIIPYIMVVFSADMTIENIVSLVVIFIIIGILYVRTNMVLTNPMLLLIGFRIFEIEYFELNNEKNKKTTLLLSKEAPWNGREMKIEEIYKGVHMENKETKYYN